MEDPLLLVFPAAYLQFQPLKLQSNALLLDLEDGLPLGAGSYGNVFRGIFHLLRNRSYRSCQKLRQKYCLQHLLW